MVVVASSAAKRGWGSLCCGLPLIAGLCFVKPSIGRPRPRELVAKLEDAHQRFIDFAAPEAKALTHTHCCSACGPEAGASHVGSTASGSRASPGTPMRGNKCGRWFESTSDFFLGKPELQERALALQKTLHVLLQSGFRGMLGTPGITSGVRWAAPKCRIHP